MENSKEIIALLNELYENISEVIKPIVEAIQKLVDSLPYIFLERLNEVKLSTDFLNKNISRKRFIKLLLSSGYQKNEALKIAWKYHEEKGQYILLDFLIENKKMEDLKYDMVSN